MPSFTITISAQEGTRVMNALCSRSELPPTQNNALIALRQLVVDVVKGYEQQQAYSAAVAAIVEPVPVTPT